MCCLCSPFYCACTGKCVIFCMTTGQPQQVTPCKPLVTATGSMTPAQLAKGLPGQCKAGPGGAAGFPACVTGTGVKINRCQVASCASSKVLGWFGCHVTEPAQKFWCCDVKKTLANLPSVWTILIVLFVLFLVVVFVYGFAKSR